MHLSVEVQRADANHINEQVLLARYCAVRKDQMDGGVGRSRVAATAATVTAAAVTVQTKAATTTTATIPEMPYKINGAARGPETTPVRGQRLRALLPR